jgi:hypothetical protein
MPKVFTYCHVERKQRELIVAVGVAARAPQ